MARLDSLKDGQRFQREEGGKIYRVSVPSHTEDEGDTGRCSHSTMEVFEVGSETAVPMDPTTEVEVLD